MSEQKKIDADRARDEFENAMQILGYGRKDLATLRCGGQYISEKIEQCWAAWQARASLPVGVPDGAPEWPEYQDVAMGCGLEDRGITDRYEAMRHGWDDAVERCTEAFNNWLAAAPTVKAEHWKGEQCGASTGEACNAKVCFANERSPDSDYLASAFPDQFTHADVKAEQVQLAGSRRNRVYLAGPMTGYAEFNFPAFNAEAARLRATGLEVVNPAEHGIVEGAEWVDYLRYDIAQLSRCESIHFLPGWQESKGARLEHSLAASLGMRMTFADGAAPSLPAAGSDWEGIAADLYEIGGKILEIANTRTKPVSTTLMAPHRNYTLKDAKATALVMGNRLVGMADKINRAALSAQQPAQNSRGDEL